MIILITIINLFNYLDRYLVASLLPHLATSFSLSHGESGFLVSSFVFGYVVASPLAGIVSAKWNRAYFALAGVLIFAFSTILCAFASSYAMFVLARIGIGIGEGIFSTIVPALISAKVNNPLKLTKVLALFFSAIPVGAALGYLLGGFAGAQLGWQSAFIIAGIGSCISGVTLLNKFWTAGEQVRTKREVSVTGLLQFAWKNKTVRYAIIGYAFHTFSLQGIAAFVSTYCGSVLGMNPDTASLVFGIILVVTGFGGTWIGGLQATKFIQKYGTSGELKFISLCAFYTTVLISLVFLVPVKLFFVVAALAELGAFLTVAPINATLLNNVSDEFKTGVQGITILVINIVGSLIGPVLVGYGADFFGLATSLQLTAVSMLLAGVFWKKSSATL